jgi:hypothetical protein
MLKNLKRYGGSEHQTMLFYEQFLDIYYTLIYLYVVYVCLSLVTKVKETLYVPCLAYV